MVVVLPLWREILSWLMEVVLPLVILHSAIPWATIPLTIIMELILVGWWVVEISILPKVLVKISLWSVIPVVASVRSIISAIWRWSIVCKRSLVWWGSISSVLISIVVRGAVVSIVSVCIVLLSLLW